MIKRAKTYLEENISIAPLVVFRIAFGALMFLSTLRFILKGWVHSMYIAPKMFFPYYGFEWVKPLPGVGMYIVFALLLIASLCVLLGLFYRHSAVLFFVLFTYVELIDKTNYLNHYYFVSLVAFMMTLVPAADHFSLDNKIFRKGERLQAPRFYIFILQLQMFIVYFFAGVAKLNYDWLINAEPLKTWLPAFSHYLVIGRFMELDITAYIFAWFGCAYDLLIGFFLFNRRTVRFAYLFVIVFHLATSLFFNIGMFPYIMMIITLIFFREDFHQRFIDILKSLLKYKALNTRLVVTPALRVVTAFFAVYFVIQVLMPMRYILYPGKLFWTEQGYRFSWRVMLMEKAGTAFFFVKDPATGKQIEVDNQKYLTYMQEKMMATQPDMMVDYARFLKEEFTKKGFVNPVINAQSYVTVNGSGSREFIDPTVDLSSLSNSFFETRTWVKSY